jgi:lipopolysaccharide/colanic/teichoic acid biosynthesis glycosyltransferase
MMKRLFDVVVASLVLFLASPLLLFGALLVSFSMGRPVLFRQIRPGYRGHPFMLYKFRTMRDTFDANGQPLSDAERLTRWGMLLRRTSIDELPQLMNVLKGDMSIVGPRPLLMEYLPLYSPEQMRRHEVKPGITGWAQVNGRNALRWEERFRLDVWYVDHRSFWVDMKILLLTIRKVLVREGISAAGDATMPKFTGSREQ